MYIPLPSFLLQVRIKGAVQAVRKPEAVAYGGEVTGIKAKLAKGRKLGA
jgi:U3 small nucleolar RNA-associated protein 3